jgi:hypothetical protein
MPKRADPEKWGDEVEFNFHLPKEFARRIHKEAERSDRSLVACIRVALREWLDKQEKNRD